MNKKEIINSVNKIIEKKYKDFSNIQPIVKKESTAIKTYTKKLKIEREQLKEKVYSLTYLKKGVFNKILRITVSESGKIIKISINK